VRRVGLLALIVGGGPAAVTGCGPAAVPADGTGVVVEVIDGDTIVVEIGGREEPVRLLGIDTPEVHVEGGDPECFGPEASAFTAGLLPAGTPVRLERDVVGRDDYGRLLAYVYVADGSGGEQLVNEALVAGGFATPLTIAPNGAFAPRFAAAARAAEAAGRGLWSSCAG
jgi:micrococcal nuclease